MIELPMPSRKKPGFRGQFEGNHVIKQQLQKALRDAYGIASIGTDAFIEKKTPVWILSTDAHRLAETAFHKKLTAWTDAFGTRNIFSDLKLPNIRATPGGYYENDYQVVDEYIRFLNFYPEYRDTIPAARAFAKVNAIPISQ
jgi:hypothetical protein